MTAYNQSSFSFAQQLKNDLDLFIEQQKNIYPPNELLKIDLHCHDYNSDVPDELLGRILNVPETWLKTEQLIKELNRNQCDVITITNHNNARSCYEQQELGMEILTGAEFSCFVPDFKVGIHVLAYGFSPQQEKKLEKLRKNIYLFQEFANSENIPTIWAHPLYHYATQEVIPIDFFNKLALIFERFEVVNGQRDTWQNMLVKTWLETLSEETIKSNAQKFGIDIYKYCKNPYRKVFTGGSDSHNSLFAGQTGSYLHVPGLQKKIKNTSKVELALEAIREGRIVPFGSHNGSEKLTTTLLEYVFQIAISYKDPGMLRILLHKGNSTDKVIAFAVANGFAEIQRHKTTMKFVRLFQSCFMGNVPAFTKKWLVPKAYKGVYDDAVEIARTNRDMKTDMVETYHRSISDINKKLNRLLFTRLEKKIAKLKAENKLEPIDINTLLERFEVSSELRTLIKPDKKNKNIAPIDIPEFLDGLSFPFLASALILAANFTAARVMYNTRPMLNLFSKETGKYHHPKRALWLSETFDDKNGVSMVLQSILKEIQRRNLPIDLLVCSKTATPQDHLIVIPPEMEINLPINNEQAIRLVNFLKIHEIFAKGEYDRLICSTEGVMGLAALYLKNAFSVKAHFYIHTDWEMYLRKNLNVAGSNLNRFRRMLRTFYSGFDSLFVLNTDQQKWLSGTKMNFKPENIHNTAHWVSDVFKPQINDKKEPFKANEESFCMIYPGRLSVEKGVLELPEIFMHVKNVFPNAKMLIAGSGPLENQLKEMMPDAIFTGWVDHDQLPKLLSDSDIMILPSKFDTFSCAVLESLACGLPVIAYNNKGPKDIIHDNKNGFLANNIGEIKEKLIYYFGNRHLHKQFKKNAVIRANEYNKETIMNKLLSNIGFNNSDYLL